MKNDEKKHRQKRTSDSGSAGTETTFSSHWFIEQVRQILNTVRF